MLFHEIYGIYYNVIAEVLNEACDNALTDKRLYEIIREKGFGESAFSIPIALKSGAWPLLTSGMKTPIKHSPSMPLTTLQKRWLRSLLDDPRIRLFGVTHDGLEGVKPLYARETFCYFDRYNDGDPFENEEYISNFRIILSAINEKRLLAIRYNGRRSSLKKIQCFPYYLEYSLKDDKFRLIATTKTDTVTLNLGRIASVEALGPPKSEPLTPNIKKSTLVMELLDERNALERAMLHFSHLEKETARLDDDHYKITLRYNKDDETELLIRVMAFGPMLRVTSPARFISLIRERLTKQRLRELS